MAGGTGTQYTVIPIYIVRSAADAAAWTAGDPGQKNAMVDRAVFVDNGGRQFLCQTDIANPFIQDVNAGLVLTALPAAGTTYAPTPVTP